jgi:hypothetical protein
MAHKRKTLPMPFLDMQHKKTEHYQRYEKLLNDLKGQRTKENALNEQIRNLELQIRNCDEIIQWCNEHPDEICSRTQLNGWMLPYKSEIALKRLRADKQENLKMLESAKTQLKLSVESQQGLENTLRSYPTFEHRMSRYYNTGHWKW